MAWLRVRLSRVLIALGAIMVLLVSAWLLRVPGSLGALPRETAPTSPGPTQASSQPGAESASAAPLQAGILARARAHDIDFVAMLADIRSQCLPEWERRECNDMTREFLREKFRDDNDGSELLRVYDQYIGYEDYVAENRPLQNLDVMDTYRTLQQLRTQFIEPDIRRWLFGAEDARMAYEFALRDFIQEEAAGLPPMERLRALADLRRQSLGEYYDLFVEREDPRQYYHTELTLLELSTSNTPEERALKAGIEDKIRRSPPSGADN